jgi:signal transduction histidine kinase
LSYVDGRNPATQAERWLSLVTAVEHLSSATTMAGVIQVVRQTARAISGADGVTFVLRDGGYCHYVEEDAIGPLWKGRRFPLETCISGWCMLNGAVAAVPDIYADARIPHDAYRPTFVKSLVMVPVRAGDPLGAIGSYWKHCREFAPEELSLLEGLARSTAAAIAAIQARERVERLQSELAHMARRTEFGQMSAEIAHELNQPLTAASAYLKAAKLQIGKQAPAHLTLDAITRAEAQFDRASHIIQRIRGFLSTAALEKKPESIARLVEEAVGIALTNPRHRTVDLRVEVPDHAVLADKIQAQQALLNILKNAFEAVEACDVRRVIVSARADNTDGMSHISVADTGPGLAPDVAKRLFAPFLTTKAHGMGVGLSISRTIVEAHGGRIWVSPAGSSGATFCLTLPLADTGKDF